MNKDSFGEWRKDFGGGASGLGKGLSFTKGSARWRRWSCFTSLGFIHLALQSHQGASYFFSVLPYPSSRFHTILEYESQLAKKNTLAVIDLLRPWSASFRVQRVMFAILGSVSDWLNTFGSCLQKLEGGLAVPRGRKFQRRDTGIPQDTMVWGWLLTPLLLRSSTSHCTLRLGTPLILQRWSIKLFLFSFISYNSSSS